MHTCIFRVIRVWRHVIHPHLIHPSTILRCTQIPSGKKSVRVARGKRGSQDASGEWCGRWVGHGFHRPSATFYWKCFRIRQLMCKKCKTTWTWFWLLQYLPKYRFVHLYMYPRLRLLDTRSKQLQTHNLLWIGPSARLHSSYSCLQLSRHWSDTDQLPQRTRSGPDKDTLTLSRLCKLPICNI